MNVNTKKQQFSQIKAIDAVASSAHEYEKPVLQVFGDVRDVTLGPTPGLGESGCECLLRASGNSNPCTVCG